MRRTLKHLLFIALAVLTLTALTRSQMSDACSDGQTVAVDVTNGRLRCVTANASTLIYRVKGVNLNVGANTDSGSTFTNLPSRYIVRRLTFENASGTPTLSTVALRTASGGGGTAIVTAQALSTLSASTTLVDSALAVTTTVQTSQTLYLRDVAAAGSAMTADAALEVEPLP